MIILSTFSLQCVHFCHIEPDVQEITLTYENTKLTCFYYTVMYDDQVVQETSYR